MRIFTAVTLPTATKEKIQETAKGRLPVSYVNTDNAHITLNFLGEIEDGRVALAREIFETELGPKEKFWIEFEKIQKFRNQIHIAVKKSEQLLELQSDLEKKFVQAGFRFPDREYYPHIKLMNLHMDNVMFRERKIENFPQELIRGISFQAEKVGLFESRLHPSFAEHVLLSEIKLL